MGLSERIPFQNAYPALVAGKHVSVTPSDRIAILATRYSLLVTHEPNSTGSKRRLH